MSLEFRCQDVGVACGSVTRAQTEDQLVAAVKAHAEDKHGVTLTDTLVDYAVAKVRSDGRGR